MEKPELNPAEPLTAACANPVDSSAASAAEIRAANWLAGALFILPFLQGLEWDFDHCAPLVLLAPALWVGRAALARGLARYRHLPFVGRIAGAGLVGLVLLATLHSPQPAASIVQLASWTLLALGGILAGQLIAEDAELSRRLFAGLASGAMSATLVHWTRWKLGADPLSAFYPHHRLMGLHLLGGALAATVLAATSARESLPDRREKNSEWLSPHRITPAIWLAVGIITWGGLLWTGGRAPVLALLFGVGVWLILSATVTRRRLFMISAAHLIGGVLLAFALDPANPELGVPRLVLRSVAGGTAKELTSNRSDFWRAGLSHVGDSPWLGFGPDAYRYLEPKLEGAQPHNAELQCLLDLGAPATVIVLLFFGLAMFRGLRRTPTNTAAFGWAILALSSLAAAQLDGFLYHLNGLFTTALALGISLLAPSKNHGGKSANKPVRPEPTGWAGWWSVPAGLAAAVVVLHMWIFYQVARAQPPLPGSPVAQVWSAFPSTSLGLDRWVEAWEKTSPDAALGLALEGRRHSPQADYFLVQAAGIHLRHGKRAAALIELDQAIAIAPWQIRPTIVELRRQIAGPPQP